MSTAGRINKSTTKFVPKRKAGSSSFNRASSATPSIAGTPHVAAQASLPLPSIDEFSLGEDPVNEAGDSGEGEGTFAAPQPPVNKPASASTSKQVSTAIAPGSSFGPSDPTASISSSQSQSQQPSSSLGSSFAPRDATSSAATSYFAGTQDKPRSTPVTTSSSPQRAPAKVKGTAFGVSFHGPQAPAHASTSTATSPPAIGNSCSSLSDLAAAAASAAEREGTLEPRTQREIEEEAEREKGLKKQKKELTKKKQELDKMAKGKTAKKGKAKGKGKAVEVEGEGKGEDVAMANGDAEQHDQQEDGDMAPPPPPPTKSKPKRKPRAAAKPKKAATKETVEDGDSSDEWDAQPVKKRRKHFVGRKKQTQMDRELLGPSGAADGDDDDEDDDDIEMVEGSDEDGQNDEGEEGDAAPKKKTKKRGKKEIVRAIVDPATTTMADIATGRDVIGGRTSERGRELARKEADSRVKRRERVQKMKRRAQRRKNGEPSETEGEDDEDAEGGGEDGAADRRRGASARSTPALSTRSTPGPREGSPPLLGAIAAAQRSGKGELDPDEIAPDDDDKVPGADDDNDAEDEGEDDFGGLVETQYAPQMRIVDGELVLDDASLEVDRALDDRLGHVGPREVIEESAKDRMVNSATWGKAKRTEKWTSQETEDFYDALRQFGTDFEMIAGLFPRRTRRQIKAKWNKEDRVNPKAITAALMTKKSIDLDHYSKVSGQDLSGPVPEDPFEKIQKRREETEALERANGGGAPAPKGRKNKREAGAEEEGVGEDVAAALAAVQEDDEDEDEDDEEAARKQKEIDDEIAAAENE